MQFRSPLALAGAYIGVIVVALAMIAAGLSAVMLAVTGGATGGVSDKTVVQDQIESSRAIRQALATPIIVPPLPPITARRAHEAPVVAAQRTTLPPRALNAMAMDQSTVLAQAPPEPSAPPAYNARDHLTGGGW